MKHFTLDELTRSDAARAHHLDNTPGEAARVALELLVARVLDPLREAWGGPLTVTSGYRCPELNRAVGGSETSAHTAGWAADLVPDSDDPRGVQGLVDFAVEWLAATGLPFDQLIDERSGGSRWLHIGARNLEGMQRRQMMAYDEGKYTEI